MPSRGRMVERPVFGCCSCPWSWSRRSATKRLARSRRPLIRRSTSRAHSSGSLLPTSSTRGVRCTLREQRKSAQISLPTGVAASPERSGPAGDEHADLGGGDDVLAPGAQTLAPDTRPGSGSQCDAHDHAARDLAADLLVAHLEDDVGLERTLEVVPAEVVQPCPAHLGEVGQDGLVGLPSGGVHQRRTDLLFVEWVHLIGSCLSGRLAAPGAAAADVVSETLRSSLPGVLAVGRLPHLQPPRRRTCGSRSVRGRQRGTRTLTAPGSSSTSAGNGPRCSPSA
jgi:hypothetical protein